MPENKVIFESKWVKVRETEKGFQYLERKGKNSIAVICEDDDCRWLIRYQPLCINGSDDELFPCPITGSLDVDGEDPDVGIGIAQKRPDDRGDLVGELFHRLDHLVAHSGVVTPQTVNQPCDG